MPTLAEIAKTVDGSVEGDGAVEITGVAGLREAGPGDVTFLSNPKYASQVAGTAAAAVVVNRDWQGTSPCAVLRVDDADWAFARVATQLGPPPIPAAPGIHPTAVIADEARIGAQVSIGPHCVIEPGARIGNNTVLVACCYVGHEVAIGDDCKLYPFVSVRERCSIGSRVTLHNGAVIGSDGFGYVRKSSGWEKIPQIGIVDVGDDVEIGANVTVDRARFGKTVIGKGVKIDNLVQIAHNVTVGDHTAMAGQVGISGSTTVGKNVMLGGQAGLSGHVAIGDGAVVGGQCGVSKDIAPGEFVFGSPAMPFKKFTRIHAHMMHLPELKARIRELEKRIEDLEAGRM